MNEQNLVPNTERTPSERQTIARNAGIASGIARRERKHAVATLFAAFKVEPINPQTLRDADAVLLAMTPDQLSEFTKRKDVPAEMIRRARLLLNADDEIARDMGEKMRDRVMGKPRQAMDVEVEACPPPVIANIFAKDFGK